MTTTFKHRSAHRRTRALCASTALIGSLMLADQAAAAEQQAQSSTDVLMGDIVVTARKREEQLQNVPIAVTAFSAASMNARGVTQLDQIAQFTPNLTYQNNPGFGGATNVAAVYIRGIGQFDFLGSIEPGVGLYVDGVYIARSVGGIMDLVDIERLEILRGPQGTLFGRNTIGGAMSITSKKPSNEFGGKASLTYGDDQRIELKGSLNLPLSDKLAVKLSGAYSTRDGYVTRISDGRKLGDKDTFVGRFQAQWKPTDNFTADISFDYTRDKSNGSPYVLKGLATTSRVFNPNNRTLLLPALPGPNGEPPLLLALYTDPETSVVTRGRPVGGGFEGVVDPASVGGLPPGVDPNTVFYQLNVQALPPRGTAPPGVTSVIGPLDAPVDNFLALYNYVTAYAPGGTPGICMAAPFQPYFSQSTDPRCVGPQYTEAALGKNTVASNYPDFSRSTIWGTSVNLSYRLDNIEFVSVSAYREINSDFARDQDLTPFNIAVTIDKFDQWQFSQEFQIKGTNFDDRLNWILGAYYFKEKVDNLNDVIFVPVRVRSGGLINNQSLAFFGQGTFKITEQLTFTGGLRWTRDKKTFDSGPYQFVQESFVGPGFAYGFDSCPGAVTVDQCPADANGVPQDGPLTIFNQRTTRLKTSRVTPYANLSYQWTPEILTYFSYSQGFKSGGFTQRVFPPQPSAPAVGPEKVSVYEAGIKSEWFDRRFRLNLSAFYTDYKDLQIQGFTDATGVAPVYFNAGSARVQGLEAEFAISPGDGWYIEGGLGYLDPKYKSLEQSIIDRSGITLDKSFERVSKWSATAAIQKDFELGSDIGIARPRIDWAYRSKYYNDATNVEQISQPGYSVFNGNVTYLSPSDSYTVTFGVNNIFNKYYTLSSIYNNSFLLYTAVPTRGREWFLRAEVKF